MDTCYLITGGAGFIGTNLVTHFIKENKKVVVVDSLVAGQKDRLPQNVVFYEEDVCNTDALREICAKEHVSVIVHLAALPRVQFSIEHPFEAQHVNVDGTLSVLEAARTSGVRRVVFASSSSVYGDQEESPLRETLLRIPKSPYALHKFMGEELMKLWNSLYGIETVSLRFFNVYGPYMDPDGAYALVIGKFLKQRGENKPLTITGDGEQTRDFIHVSDLSRAIFDFALYQEILHGEVYNVGTGKSISVNTLAKYIGGPVEYVPSRIEPRHTEADISRIRDVLGWTPKVTLEEGVSVLKKEFGIM